MAYSRNVHDENGDGFEDTVYRYLCPVRKAGSVIGKGGEIAKQIRFETKANLRVNQALPGCDERVVTIYSTSEETNRIDDDDEDFVCPAFDALFKVHDMIVGQELSNDDYDYDDDEYKTVVTARMLVPSDQIGCLIGKGGQVIQNLRNETNAQIRVISDNLPICALALSHDELLQITGNPSAVREALYQVASLLYENPSQFQNYFLSSPSTPQHQHGGILMSPALTSSRKNYSAPRDVSDERVFSICFICPAENVGGVIGKGGCFINQIRQESGASIKVDTSETGEDDDCVIYISSKEFFEDQSPTVIAALRLQTRCSEKVGKDSSDSAITTRVLVPSSQVGCLIGKGGALISEMRSVTKANIRIFQGEDVPTIAREDEEMVQITGSFDAAIKALTQVMLRLRANVFDMDHGLVLLPTFFPYISQTTETSSKPKHKTRENHSHGSMETARKEDYSSQMNLNSPRRKRVY
ncbi:PREDICTED: KH domain-containing protein At4g18375-like [Camelina sativa]|uniref:KH domain-containing protein At4g18375-like n=1 Tax=Camelina sativa TaxID=90675 RepID=A0ABM0YKB4_CAMSA|nr:PREDICTED: KH domain-containing protein At4g18375-like [Camelina sativa]